MLKQDTSFEACTKCTVCTIYCPVSEVNIAYPGPKQAGPDGERLRLKDPLYYDESLKYCTNCKRCEVACPSDVKIGDIIQRAKINFNKQRPKLRDALLSHTDLAGTLSTPFAPLVNPILKLKPVRKLLDKTLQIDERRTLPSYSRTTFKQWYRRSAPAQSQFQKQVAFYHGCYVNYNHPQLGQDLIKVFNALGIGVQLIKGEKCCGVPLIANGFTKKARHQAQHNIDTLNEVIEQQSLEIVATSSTCTFTLRDEYQDILGLDNHLLHKHVELATRYLYRLINQGAKLPLRALPVKVAYHIPCHMQKLGWASYTDELMKLIPEIQFVSLPSQCCGIAGTYGFKKENYETSQKIGENLFSAIDSQQIDYVISDCETCKWQIEMSTQRPCIHPITLLAMALETKA